MNIKERIEYLRDEINAHNHAYYILDKPTISDFNFDKLLSELISLIFIKLLLERKVNVNHVK